MKVDIVTFPETKVGVVSHVGPPSGEHETARKLVSWKLEHRLLDPTLHRTYGLHYTDPRTVNPPEHRVDCCLSFDGRVESNVYGVVEGIIPAMKCALREKMADQPLIFHYVNVGPGVKEHEAITDVYMPLK